MSRVNVASGSPFEPIVGFSRCVRIGNMVCIGGTAPIGMDGKTVGVGDPGEQMRRCIEIAGDALAEAGASLGDVIRTRTMLTRIEDWEVVGKVHGASFGDIRPVNTIVQVSRFIDPDWLVEVEFDAVVAGA